MAAMAQQQKQPDRLQPIDIVFDSKSAANQDNPVFTLDPPLDNIVGMNVQWVSAPFSYYVIDSTNNEFEYLWEYIDDNTAAMYPQSSKIFNFVARDTGDPAVFTAGSPAVYPAGGVGVGSVKWTDADGYSLNVSKLLGGRPACGYSKAYLKPGTYTPDALTEALRQIAPNYFEYNTLGSELFGQTLTTVNLNTGFNNRDSWGVHLDSATSLLTIYNTNMPKWDDTDGDDGVKRAIHFAFRFKPELAAILGFEPNVWHFSNFLDTYTGSTKVTATSTKGGRDRWVQVIFGTRSANFLQNQRLNIHSNLASTFEGQRSLRDTTDIIKSVPIDSNYSAYIVNAANAEPYLITRSNIKDVYLYLTIGDRRLYATNFTMPASSFSRYDLMSFTTQEYLHLNGQGFQVCIRFYRDDGVMMQ